MAYIALYRKWRPQDFNNLIGQEHIRKTLANAIEQGKVAHAYLFSGSRGTGKTSTAKILAKALNCEQGPTANPCNKCDCCEKINNGSFMDVFEIDAASNRGIDEIRELRETVKFAPVDGKYKVYIIDEVHMLTTEAFNALLKTLEEPPSHVVFILATTEVHKVPITIQSRCQRYDFKRITKEDILGRLQEVMESTEFTADPAALELIAIQSDGGMRDALSILDQCLAFAQGNLTVEEVHKVLGLVGNQCIWQLTDCIIAKEENEVLSTLNELIVNGKDLKQILSEFILHLRSLMIYKATNRMVNMEVYLEDEQVLQRQAQVLSHSRITNLMQLANETLNNLKWAPNGRIALETMFLKMCWLDQGSSSSAATQVMPAEVPAKQDKREQTNYLLGKIQALENLVQSLTQSLEQIKAAGISVNPGTQNTAPVNPQPQEANPKHLTIDAPPPMAATASATPSTGSMASVPMMPSAMVNETQQMLNNLAKLTPAAPTLMPGLNTTGKSKNANQNSEKTIEIHIPEQLKMTYTGNIHQLWQRVKQVLYQNKGFAGMARMITDPENVEPYQFINNVFYINALRPFVYHRVEQSLPDLRRCIMGITGLDVQVQILFMGKNKHNEAVVPTEQVAVAPEPPPIPPKAPQPEEEIALPEAPPPLDDEYFGGEFYDMPSLPAKEPVEIPKEGDAFKKALEVFGCDMDDEDVLMVEE